MKKQLFTLFMALIALTHTAFSQEFKVKKDTAYVDGKALCVIKDRAFGTEYRILSRKGKELIFAKAETIGAQGFFTLSFLDNGVQCEREIEMGFGKKLVRELYERGALTLDADTINADGLKKFLMTHTRKFSEEAKAKTAQRAENRDNQGDRSAPNVQLIERNREATIFAAGNSIQQDGKQLGKYTMNDQAIIGGIQTTVKINDTNGNAVAELVFKSLSDKTGNVFTFVDRRSYSFTSNEAHNSFNLAKDFAQFLIDKRYL